MSRQNYLERAADIYQSSVEYDYGNPVHSGMLLVAIYKVLRAIAEPDTTVMGVDVKSSGEVGPAAVAAMFEGFKLEKSSRDYMQAIADAMNDASVYTDEHGVIANDRKAAVLYDTGRRGWYVSNV